MMIQGLLLATLATNSSRRLSNGLEAFPHAVLQWEHFKAASRHPHPGLLPHCQAILFMGIAQAVSDIGHRISSSLASKTTPIVQLSLVLPAKSARLLRLPILLNGQVVT
jgi:hypothetical protein